jgi:hypothetical protein
LRAVHAEAAGGSQKAYCRSASPSAKPYSVIESSRTIIAVTRRASAPRLRLASVDGVHITLYPTPAASMTA